MEAQKLGLANLLSVAERSGATDVKAGTEVWTGIAGIFNALCSRIEDLEAQLPHE